MSFTNYTIVPVDEVVVVDGQAAQGVSMTGIPATVHAIQWYGLMGQGTIEYKIDPTTGILPAPGSFTDPNLYSLQVAQAQTIIEAQNNPLIVYSTADGVTYGGFTYDLGAQIIINTPNPVPPSQSTPSVPPTPEDFQQLYWYNNAWVVSSFNPSYSLSEAKNVLNTNVAASAAEQGAMQARIYSPVQLFAATDVSALGTADYFGVTLGEYQTYLDGQVTIMQSEVNSATQVPALYSFNPSVDGNPNP